MRRTIFLRVLVAALLVSGLQSFAQSKKDIKRNKVKSITESRTFSKNGKEVTVKESFEKYDGNGNLMEVKIGRAHV